MRPYVALAKHHTGRETNCAPTDGRQIISLLSPALTDMPKLAPHRVPLPESRSKPVLFAEITEEPITATSPSLWGRLERATAGAGRARAEARRASASSFTGLDVAFSPHGQEARLKARSFLTAATRASARLQAAVEELEAEAAAAKAAHEADHAGWMSDQRLLIARLDMAHEATARTLRHELQASEIEMSAQAEALSRLLKDEVHKMEIDHTRQVRALTHQFDAERATLHDEAAGLRARCERLKQQAAADATAARQEYDDLQSENIDLKRQLAGKSAELHEANALREAEQAAAAALQASNAKLRSELSSVGSDLEHGRAELRGQVDRLSREKTAINSELEAQVCACARVHTLVCCRFAAYRSPFRASISPTQVSHLHDLRDAEVNSLQTSLGHVKMTQQVALAQLHAQIEALNAERAADASAYHSKILRLQAVQRAALTAGSARGRQLLYTESLRSPDLHRASSISWRGAEWEGNGGDEVDAHPEWLTPHPARARSPPTAPPTSMQYTPGKSSKRGISSPRSPRTPRSKRLS